MNFSSRPGMSGCGKRIHPQPQSYSIAGLPVDAAVGTGAEPGDELRLALAHARRADDKGGARPVGAFLNAECVVGDFAPRIADSLLGQHDERALGSGG